MKNPRITTKELGLIKGALRRVFSRSDLRRSIIEAAIIPHTDLSRPRVKSWGLCAVCKKPTPKSYLVVDHILPLVPLDQAFEEMSMDTFLDRLWCDPSNLQPICPEDHLQKSKEENKIRRVLKKEKSNVRCKANPRPNETSRKRSSSRSSKRTNVSRIKKSCRRPSK